MVEWDASYSRSENAIAGGSTLPLILTGLPRVNLVQHGTVRRFVPDSRTKAPKEEISFSSSLVAGFAGCALTGVEHNIISCFDVLFDEPIDMSGDAGDCMFCKILSGKDGIVN